MTCNMSFGCSIAHMQFPTVSSTKGCRGSVAYGSCSKVGKARNWTGNPHDRGHFANNKKSGEAGKCSTTTIQDVTTKTTEAPSNVVAPEEKLACPLCSKMFSQQGSLNRHLKMFMKRKRSHFSFAICRLDRCLISK